MHSLYLRDTPSRKIPVLHNGKPIKVFYDHAKAKDYVIAHNRMGCNLELIEY